MDITLTEEWRLVAGFAVDQGLITHFKNLLSADDVAKIRSLGGTMTQSNIAKLFGTTQSNVSLILAGRTWAVDDDHIPKVSP